MDSKVSVIMPVYNVEKYIAKSIQSVLNQTYSDFELLIINDGSPDESVNIAKKFHDNRIKILDKPNGGLSDARNYGLLHSTGDFVYFIDSDDWIESNLLEKTVKAIKEKDVDFVVFGYCLDNEDANCNLVSSENVSCENFLFEKELNNIRFNKNILNLLGYAWNKLYKANFLKSNNLIFDKGISLVEDILFNAKVYIKTDKIFFINCTLYHYIDRPAVSLIKKFHKNSFDLIILKNKALDNFLNNWNVEKEIKNKILSENINHGIRYCINNLFGFKNDLTEIERINYLSMIINHEETQKNIVYYSDISFYDKLYKKIIKNKAVFLLYLLCKIKK